MQMPLDPAVNAEPLKYSNLSTDEDRDPPVHVVMENTTEEVSQLWIMMRQQPEKDFFFFFCVCFVFLVVVLGDDNWVLYCCELCSSAKINHVKMSQLRIIYIYIYMEGSHTRVMYLSNPKPLLSETTREIPY